MAKRRKSPGPMHSRTQWRFLFATHKKFARKWAHQTAGGPKVRYHRLPERVHVAKGRRSGR